jgi:UDP-glucose:(heptosyl)LPS alpha-1,3-glucosyltransferase
LRLAVVSPFVDRRHGTERALAELLDRLARTYQCEIHLYAEQVEDLAWHDRRAAPTGEKGAIFWHKVPALPGPLLTRFSLWIFLNSLLRWYHRIFRGLSFDLVLSPGINCLDADVVIIHALFHRLRELSGETPAQTGFFRRLHRRAYYGLLTALERRVYSNGNVLLAGVSRRTAGLVQRYFGRGDVRVIPNGVNTLQFSASTRLALRGEARKRRRFQDDDFVLLLVGNDWRVKGVPAVIAAMAAAPGVPFRLLVAGEDAAEPFREVARRLGVAERCRWEDPRRDVIDFYAAADAYVSPSLEDSFGMPVAEAMACGLPVTTSVFAGVSDLIRDEAEGFVLRDPDDVQVLAQLLTRLQGDVALRQRVGEAAAEAVQTWTWDRNAAEVWELLQAAAKKKQVARAAKG